MGLTVADHNGEVGTSREGAMRVVVVGAGFAGLMSAWRMHQAGHDVVVLEARDRVGGRVWSYEIDAGDPERASSEALSSS